MADKKRLAIIGVSSLVLVVIGAAVTLGIVMSGSDDGSNSSKAQVTTTMNAIQAVCQPTDYKETCVNAFNAANVTTTDPKELIRAAFQIASNYVEEAAKKSVTLQELEKDPRGAQALKDCKELMGYSVNELQASFDKLGSLETSQVGPLVADIKTWLSAAVTYQETCLDGFQNTSGDAGEKMRQALKVSSELTVNGLAMIDEVAAALESLDISNFRRRLLSDEEVLGHGADESITWMAGPFKRRLLAQVNEEVLGHGGDAWDSGSFLKRKLLKEVDGKWKPGSDVERLITTPIADLHPDLVVAKDGSGDYTTINETLKDIPFKGDKMFVIYVKEGVYKEQVEFNRNMTNVFLVGDGPTKTRITFGLNFIDGTPTFRTATVAAIGDNFMARDIGFENSAGAEKHQAVALRVQSDMSVFYNCHLDGYQDTLYAHTKRQFYRNCTITGTIDFIFGDSPTVFQNCKMLIRKPLFNQQTIVTAQGRKMPRQPTGLVLQNCTISMDPAFPFDPVMNKAYLGRPWKMYSRTIIMDSYIDSLINSDGWMPWFEDFGLRTCYYTEYRNRGPGSDKSKRVTWPGIKSSISERRATLFTPGMLLQSDEWLNKTGVPFVRGMMNIKATEVPLNLTKPLNLTGDPLNPTTPLNVTGAPLNLNLTGTTLNATGVPLNVTVLMDAPDAPVNLTTLLNATTAPLSLTAPLNVTTPLDLTAPFDAAAPAPLTAPLNALAPLAAAPSGALAPLNATAPSGALAPSSAASPSVALAPSSAAAPSGALHP